MRALAEQMRALAEHMRALAEQIRAVTMKFREEQGEGQGTMTSKAGQSRAGEEDSRVETGAGKGRGAHDGRLKEEYMH